tara:strand:+ start:1367 stop:1639 length:273 start_codon:yes stop_codon:yes gene_type:complete
MHKSATMSAIKNYLHSLEPLTVEELSQTPLNQFALEDLSEHDWDLIIGAIHAALIRFQQEKKEAAASHYKDLYERILFARITANSLNKKS